MFDEREGRFGRFTRCMSFGDNPLLAHLQAKKNFSSSRGYFLADFCRSIVARRSGNEDFSSTRMVCKQVQVGPPLPGPFRDMSVSDPRLQTWK